MRSGYEKLRRSKKQDRVLWWSYDLNNRGDGKVFCQRMERIAKTRCDA